MPLGDVRSIHLPYCVQRQKNGRYLILNREYLPLGFKSLDRVDLSAVSMKLRGLREATAAKISFNGSGRLDAIYLYNDGSIPTGSAAKMEAYAKRLAVLARLKVG